MDGIVHSTGKAVIIRPLGIAVCYSLLSCLAVFLPGPGARPIHPTHANGVTRDDRRLEYSRLVACR